MTMTTRSGRSAKGQGSTAERSNSSPPNTRPEEAEEKGVRNGWRLVCEAWVDSRVESRQGVSTPVSDLYNTYIAENPDDYMDIGQFGKILRSRFPNGKCRRGKQGEQIYMYQNVAIKPKQGATSQSITLDRQDYVNKASPSLSPNNFEGFTAQSVKQSAVSRKIFQEQRDGYTDNFPKGTNEARMFSVETVEGASALSQTAANISMHGPKRMILEDQFDAVPHKKGRYSVEGTSFADLLGIVKEEPEVKEDLPEVNGELQVKEKLEVKEELAVKEELVKEEHEVKEEPKEEEYELKFFDIIQPTENSAALDSVDLSYTTSSSNYQFHMYPPDFATFTPINSTNELQISPHLSGHLRHPNPPPDQARNPISPENHSTSCILPLHQSESTTDSRIPAISSKLLNTSLDYNNPDSSAADYIMSSNTKTSECRPHPFQLKDCSNTESNTDPCSTTLYRSSDTELSVLSDFTKLSAMNTSDSPTKPNTLPVAITVPQRPASYHSDQCKLNLSNPSDLTKNLNRIHTSPTRVSGVKDSDTELQKDFTLTSKTNYRMALARRWVDANLTHQDGARIGADEIWEAYNNDNPKEPLPATSMAIIIRGKYPNRRKAYIEDRRECFYYQDIALIRKLLSSQHLLNQTSQDNEEVALQHSIKGIKASNHCFSEEKELNPMAGWDGSSADQFYDKKGKEAMKTCNERNVVQTTQSLVGEDEVFSETFGKNETAHHNVSDAKKVFIQKSTHKKDVINPTFENERINVNVNSSDDSKDDTSTVESVVVGLNEGKTLPSETKEIQSSLRKPTVGIRPQGQLQSFENENSFSDCSSEIQSKLDKSVCATDLQKFKKNLIVSSKDSCEIIPLQTNTSLTLPANSQILRIESPDTLIENSLSSNSSTINIALLQEDASDLSTKNGQNVQSVCSTVATTLSNNVGTVSGIVKNQTSLNSSQNYLDEGEALQNKDISLSEECQPGMTVMDYIMSEMTEEQSETNDISATSQKQFSPSSLSVESESLVTSNCIDKAITSRNIHHHESRCLSDNEDNVLISDKDKSLHDTSHHDALPLALPTETLESTTLLAENKVADDNDSVSTDISKSLDDNSTAERNCESLCKQSWKKGKKRRKKRDDNVKGKVADSSKSKKTESCSCKMTDKDKMADDTEDKKVGCTEGKAETNKKLKSWDEDIRRYIGNDKCDWYQAYLSTKANKKANEKKLESSEAAKAVDKKLENSEAAQTVKVKKIIVKKVPKPFFSSLRKADRQTSKSTTALNSRISKSHDAVFGTTSQPGMEAQTYGGGAMWEGDVKIVGEVLNAPKSDTDIEIISEVVNVRCMEKIGTKNTSEGNLARGSGVVPVAKKISIYYENSYNSQGDNIITGKTGIPSRVLDTGTGESGYGSEDIESKMRDIESTGTFKPVEMLTHKQGKNTAETVSENVTNKHKISVTETVNDNQRGKITESSDKTVVKDSNNETRRDGNMSDSESAKSLVIDLDDSVESTSSDAQNNSVVIENPAAVQTMKVFKDGSNVQGQCIKISVKENNSQAGIIEKDKETQKQTVDAYSKEDFNLSERVYVENVALSETESSFVTPSAEKLEESVLMAAFDVLSDSKLALNVVEIARRLEYALLSSNPAVSYKTDNGNGPDNIVCVASSSLEKIKSLTPDDIKVLLLHHQCCPGLGCRNCHILRAAYIHITLFRHRCHVWCSFAAIVKRHTETCQKLICSVLFCHFVKHMLHLNGRLVLNQHPEETQPVLLKEFNRCHTLGPHGTNFICNHHFRKRLPLQVNHSSLTHDVNSMIKLIKPKGGSNVDLIKPVYDTFHIAASQKHAKI